MEHPVGIEQEKQRKERNVEGKGFARQPRTSLKGLSSDDVSPRPQNGRHRVCTSVARSYVCSAFLNKKKGAKWTARRASQVGNRTMNPFTRSLPPIPRSFFCIAFAPRLLFRAICSTKNCLSCLLNECNYVYKFLLLLDGRTSDKKKWIRILTTTIWRLIKFSKCNRDLKENNVIIMLLLKRGWIYSVNLSCGNLSWEHWSRVYLEETKLTVDIFDTIYAYYKFDQ